MSNQMWIILEIFNRPRSRSLPEPTRHFTPPTKNGTTTHRVKKQLSTFQFLLCLDLVRCIMHEKTIQQARISVVNGNNQTFHSTNKAWHHRIKKKLSICQSLLCVRTWEVLSASLKRYCVSLNQWPQIVRPSVELNTRILHRYKHMRRTSSIAHISNTCNVSCFLCVCLRADNSYCVWTWWLFLCCVKHPTTETKKSYQSVNPWTTTMASEPNITLARSFARGMFEFHHFDIQGTGQNSQRVNTALKRLRSGMQNFCLSAFQGQLEANQSGHRWRSCLGTAPSLDGFGKLTRTCPSTTPHRFHCFHTTTWRVRASSRLPSRHPGQTALNNDGLAGNRRYDNQNDHQTSAKCGVVLCDVMCCAVYCGVCCVWLCIVVVLLLYYMVCAECV